MSFRFFEEIRRENADRYTASPIDAMTDEDLAKLAADVEMTVEELQEHATRPHVEMTCPLCGQPQTHLVNCKGCGGDAFGWEFEAAHGEDAADRLRQRLREFLRQDEDLAADQIRHATGNAYRWGGYMVCSICWHHTLPAEAYLTCPLNLLSERVLAPHRLPHGLFLAVWQTPKEQWKRAVRAWLDGVCAHWTEVWNTVSGPEHEVVAGWRARLLHAALTEMPPGKDAQTSAKERGVC